MILRRLRKWPLYPLFYAAIPVLSLYSINQTTVILSVIVKPLLIYGLVCLAAAIIFSILFRDRQRGAVAASLFLLVSMILGQGFELMHQSIVGRYLFDQFYYAIAAATLALLVVVIRVVRSPSVVESLRKILIYAGAGLVGYQLTVIGLRQRLAVEDSLAGSGREIGSANKSDRQQRPDIYYIILDGYGREDALKEFYGYDNGPFIRFLISKGFYVAPQSRANYGVTSLSLASSLSMDYLDELNRVPTQDAQALDKIRHSKVSRFLNEQGYKILHFNSGWVVTGEKQVLADINFDSRSLDEFNATLLRTSLLRFAFSDRLHVASQREVIQYNLAKIEEAAEIPGPKYVFLHLVCPHPPFVFDRRGRMPERTKSARRLEADWLPKERYIDQLAYISARIQEVVTQILQKSKSPPIIIIQGDHGPASDQMTAHPSEDFIRQRISILNAYYLPGKASQKLYPSITPVNTFRLIVDDYFDGHMGILKDRSYYCGPLGASPYAFLDVTNSGLVSR